MRGTSTAAGLLAGPLWRLLDFLDDFGRDSGHQAVAGNVFGDDGTGSNDDVTTDGDAGQDDSVGSNPDIVSYGNLTCCNALLVNSLSGVFEAVVKSRDGDALCQVDVAADGDGPDNGVV